MEDLALTPRLEIGSRLWCLLSGEYREIILGDLLEDIEELTEDGATEGQIRKLVRSELWVALFRYWLNRIVTAVQRALRAG